MARYGSVLIGSTDRQGSPPAPPADTPDVGEAVVGSAAARLPFVGLLGPPWDSLGPEIWKAGLTEVPMPARLSASALERMGQFWAHLGGAGGYRAENDLPPDAPYDPVEEARRERAPRQRSLKLGTLTRQAEAQRAKRELRLRLIAHFGGRCKDCGIVGPPAIYQFDHRDPFTKAGMVSRFTTWETALAEAEKCDLVCCNCHAIRTQRDVARIQAARRARLAKRSAQ